MLFTPYAYIVLQCLVYRMIHKSIDIVELRNGDMGLDVNWRIPYAWTALFGTCLFGLALKVEGGTRKVSEYLSNLNKYGGSRYSRIVQNPLSATPGFSGLCKRRCEILWNISYLIVQAMVIVFIVHDARELRGVPLQLVRTREALIIRGCPNDYRAQIPTNAAPAFVSSNNGGNLVAIGSPKIFNGTSDVLVYDRFKPKDGYYEWINFRSGINGSMFPNASDWFGSTVAISSIDLGVKTGTVLAISDVKALDSGRVHVLKWNDARTAPHLPSSNKGFWTSLGDDIHSDAPGANFGASLALSTSGTLLAIGASPYFPDAILEEDSLNSYSNVSTFATAPVGFFRVFRLVGGDGVVDNSGVGSSLTRWEQIGNKIISTLNPDGGDGFGMVIQSITEDDATGDITLKILSPPQYYREAWTGNLGTIVNFPGYMQTFQLKHNHSYWAAPSRPLEYFPYQAG